MPMPENPRKFYENTMPNAPDSVVSFYSALTGRDRNALLNLLASDYVFESPGGTIRSPEDYADMVGSFEAWVDTTNMIVQGDSVAHEFVLNVIAPFKGKIPSCDIFLIKDGKIMSSRAYNNPADFPAPA